jgi:hypothetical protein
MRNVLLAFFSVLAVVGGVQAGAAQDFVTLDPQPESSAWWVRARFHPFETKVRGIPVQDIRKTWCKASEFRRELFPRDFEFDDGLFFSIDGFFDGSKIKQTALVGAYETCDGATGGFLLIVGWEPRGLPAVRFVSELKTDHPFSILRAEKDSSIMKWNCMSCDDGGKLKWDRSKRRFVWIELSGD